MDNWGNAWIAGERVIYLFADSLTWRFHRDGARFPVNGIDPQQTLRPMRVIG